MFYLDGGYYDILFRKYKKFIILCMHKFLQVPFGTQKILRKEKKTKKNNFLMFNFNVENRKENKI